MKKIILILALLLFAGVLFGQEADLRYIFREGKNHKFKEKIVSKTTADVMGKKGVNETETLLDIDETVLEGGEEGKSRQISSLGFSPIDGKDNLENIPQEDRVTTVLFRQDKRGKCLELCNEDGTVFEGFEPEKENSILPDRKVKVGDTWEWKRVIEGLKVTAKCTLGKLYSKDGVDIARIDMKFDETIIDSDEEISGEIKVTGSGVFYYAVNYGNDLYLKYTVDLDTQFSMDVNGETGEAIINTNYTYTYWRYN
ncbi:MAG: hypothetical protein KBT47_09585 [Armatimonadetes bacterium]|nr:hypothetical protein [Candidatus Hippobium faecium]